MSFKASVLTVFQGITDVRGNLNQLLKILHSFSFERLFTSEYLYKVGITDSSGLADISDSDTYSTLLHLPVLLFSFFLCLLPPLFLVSSFIISIYTALYSSSILVSILSYLLICVPCSLLLLLLGSIVFGSMHYIFQKYLTSFTASGVGNLALLSDISSFLVIYLLIQAIISFNVLHIVLYCLCAFVFLIITLVLSSVCKCYALKISLGSDNDAL